jgi:hypothetical protein
VLLIPILLHGYFNYLSWVYLNLNISKLSFEQ